LFTALVLLGVACAGQEKSAAPAPASTPPAAGAATPAPAATAAPAPAAPSLQQTTSAALDTATIRIDPRSNEPASTFVTELIKYHPSKLPLWEKAKYGGERLGTSAYNPAVFNNPLKNYYLGRPNFFGMFLLVDVGTCSLVNRTDFSLCPGKRTNNLGGTLVPGLVERWEQSNAVTIVLHIRQGVLWPAISPMNRPDRTLTAEDVKWYFQIQKKEGVFRDTFLLIETIDVLDRFTLKLNFREPHADFIRMLASAGLGILSKECYEEQGCLDKHIISPGPFILNEKTYEPRVRSVIERNPEFYLKGLPYLDRQLGVTITDPAAQKAAFITRKTDHFSTFSPTERDALVRQYPQSYLHVGICTCGSAHFEMRMDKQPMTDVRVRQAVSMGMDRAKAWQVAREGFDALGMPMAYDYLGLELPVSLKEAGSSYQYNPDAAKRLLNEAGYSQGLTVPVFSSWRTYGSPELILSIAEDLKKVGVQLDVRMVDGVTATQMQLDKKWDGFWFSQCYSCSAVDSDSYFLAAYSKSPQNYMGINDPKIDDMYLRARQELDPAKRQAILWDFTRYMFDQVYGVHFGTPTIFCHFAGWLRNAACHVYAYAGVHNMTGWIMWVDQDQMPK
jgi:peptide/nickel transport system substrate-binding protein/glutathione transport system substrate-binding protein